MSVRSYLETRTACANSKALYSQSELADALTEVKYSLLVKNKEVGASHVKFCPPVFLPFLIRTSETRNSFHSWKTEGFAH